MTTHHDKRLAQAIRDVIREANQRHDAPDFDAMWLRAGQPHAANDDRELPVLPRLASLLAACAAALLCAAWWLAQPTAQPEPPAAPAPVTSHQAPAPLEPEDSSVAQLDEAARWDAPTDFLLAEGTLWDGDEAWDVMWDEALDEQL
jgi:hypothetical protein